MSRRGITLLTAAGLALILGVLMFVLPVPYVILVPGPPTDTLGAVPKSTDPVISVTGAQTYDGGGHLYLTTVGVFPGPCSSHPTLFRALRAWFDSHEAVEPHQVICPPDQSSDAVQQENANEMTQSQRDAMTAALLYLGYKPRSLQVILASVSPSAPSAKVLRAGDAHLILLKDRFWGYVLPSKIYACLELEAPIVYVGPAESDLHLLLTRRSGPWFHAAAGDVESGFRALEALAEQVLANRRTDA